MARIQTESQSDRHGIGHFIKTEFLDSFLDGNLSLAHFAEYRGGDGDPAGKYDPDEGFMSIGSPANTRVFIGQESIPGQLVPLEQCHELTSLVGPIKLSASSEEKCHIFCCSAFSLASGKFDGRLANGKNHLIAFSNLREFNRRFDQAVLDAGLTGYRDFVEYIDENEVRRKPLFFAKTLGFAYQREVRFAVFGHPLKDRLVLKLGNLRDIVRVLNLSDANHIQILRGQPYSLPEPTSRA